jgi:asparagine synthase
MYFTLAVSAATRQACDALAEAAERTDPRVMPIPGPARVTWRAPDGRAVVLHWGDADSPGRSHAGTIWAESATVHARTGLTRVDPVYLAEVAGAMVVSDRACWAAAVTGRMGDPDPAMAAAFLSLGYPVGDATPFRGVRALGGDRTLRLAGGRLAGGRLADRHLAGAEDEQLAGADRVAEALTEAVRPLGGTDTPVELSLTGGKDSRLVAAALAAARVPFRARTHGFDGHPDVVVAGLIADRLGVEHTVTRPRPPGAPDEADVLRRLCPDLLGLPLAGTPWHGEPRTAATVLPTPPGPAAADWRRDYGDAVAGFLRGYVLDHGEAAPVFGVVRRRAAERLLRAPQADRHGVWALATLTALLSGDWLNAREPASQARLG